MPRREIVIRLSEEVQALNRGAFMQQQAATPGDVPHHAATHVAEPGRSRWPRAHASRFSRRSTPAASKTASGNRAAKELQTTRDLQHLSAKLIHAQEEERRSIARELHDEVGQVLTAIKVELAVAQHTIEAAGGAAEALRRRPDDHRRRGSNGPRSLASAAPRAARRSGTAAPRLNGTCGASAGATVCARTCCTTAWRDG